EFLMLAHTYDASKHMITGWMASEKLDGNRCMWDGGITRGMKKFNVPWANTDKDDRYVKQQYATGLWSRYGNVIHAPDEWLDQLPKILLDGELDCGNRQTLVSIIKKLNPDPEEWKRVKFKVF